jgi:DNA-binding MarR family transcriptional regulator
MMSIPPDEDLTLLFTALHAAADAAVLAQVVAAGYPDIRVAHGYVFQHLVEGPIRVSDLAHKLGMTPQGASKLIVDLERRGYVQRRADPDDQRNRFVELTERGWGSIAAGRAARAAITAEWRAILGDAAADNVIAALQRLAAHTGGMRELLARRLRPRH